MRGSIPKLLPALVRALTLVLTNGVVVSRAFADTPLVFSANSFRLNREGLPRPVRAHFHLNMWSNGKRPAVPLTHRRGDKTPPP